MISEITEENEEGETCFIDTEAQKQRVRKIIEFQKSLYRSSSSMSSSSASSSSFSASHKTSSSSLFNLMRRGSTSLRRLFDMEHTSLSTYFESYSGSPLIKTIPLWGGGDDDSDDQGIHFDDPWVSIKQLGRPTIDDGHGQTKPAYYSDGSTFLDWGGFAFLEHKKGRVGRQKLTRKRSFRQLPGFGFRRFRGFRFRFRLIRRLRIVICGRKQRKCN
ncbi:hypothetical protein FNV43_RR10467 [Rhamnella rubrinervis]|uniref:Uncharacterized protein n=1 Tax=Rhamnella rubrinervis TaxID=2594499 RepID=A0A8K0MKR1_9ROSA|nr:hypothetical protein FNV43_RR10467 [Rhamnella rubrinervis]